MTMPEKISVLETPMGGYWCEEDSRGATYIRKDLADDLALALVMLLGGYDYHADAETILATYDEATK